MDPYIVGAFFVGIAFGAFLTISFLNENHYMRNPLERNRHLKLDHPLKARWIHDPMEGTRDMLWEASNLLVGIPTSQAVNLRMRLCKAARDLEMDVAGLWAYEATKEGR